MPFWLTRIGPRARQYSSSKTSHSAIPTPRPPNSSGHETTDQRSAAMVASHERWASKPSAVSSEGSEPGAGTCASSHERAAGAEGLLVLAVSQVHGALTVGWCPPPWVVGRHRVPGPAGTGPGCPRNLTHRQISGNHRSSATMWACRTQ